MGSIKSLHSLVLDIPPSCIEFVPGQRNLFIVGTYYLDRSAEGQDEPVEEVEKKSQQRSGSLLLFGLDGDEPKLLQTVPTPFAVFDLHFAPSTHNNPGLLGAASSTGSLALYRVSSGAKTIQHLRTLQLFPETSLITFFNWHPTIASVAGLTLSDGSVYICSITSSANPSAADSNPASFEPTNILLHTHDLEAWFTAFLPDGSGLFTGGDDSVLKYRNLPTSTTSPSELLRLAADEAPASQWQDRKSHFAGVTAILPLAPGLLLTGSYDDHIRLFQLPGPDAGVRRPAVLADLDLEGGVWRLKDITPRASSVEGEQRDEFVILASCMHAGTRVLRLKVSSPDAWEFEVLARFEEHRSMNYGSDVQPSLLDEDGSGQRTIVSTSFYDRLLCVWKW